MSDIKKIYYYSSIKYMDDDGTEHTKIIGPCDNGLYLEQNTRNSIDDIKSKKYHVVTICYEKVCEM